MSHGLDAGCREPATFPQILGSKQDTCVHLVYGSPDNPNDCTCSAQLQARAYADVISHMCCALSKEFLRPQFKSLLTKPASAHSSACVGACAAPCRCTFDTDAVAKLLGYSYSFALAAGCLVAYLLVLHVLTFLALALVARRERS